jgi:hypothetical protein
VDENRRQRKKGPISELESIANPCTKFFEKKIPQKCAARNCNFRPSFCIYYIHSKYVWLGFVELRGVLLAREVTNWKPFVLCV